MYVPTFTRRVKERLFSMFYIKHRTEDIEVLLYRSIPDEGRQLKRHGAEAVARQRARPTCSRMPASQLARRLVCWRWAGWRLLWSALGARPWNWQSLVRHGLPLSLLSLVGRAWPGYPQGATPCVGAVRGVGRAPVRWAGRRSAGWCGKRCNHVSQQGP